MAYFRADYWKSQDKKFCDYCKCWIADNKPSISFHEGGRRHKENVSKRLKDIYKKSAKEQKQNRKYEDDMKKMEMVMNKSFFYSCRPLCPLHLLLFTYIDTFLYFYLLI